MIGVVVVVVAAVHYSSDHFSACSWLSIHPSHPSPIPTVTERTRTQMHTKLSTSTGLCKARQRRGRRAYMHSLNCHKRHTCSRWVECSSNSNSRGERWRGDGCMWCACRMWCLHAPFWKLRASLRHFCRSFPVGKTQTCPVCECERE